MMDLRVVAFDCDGVMFDTLDANRHYYNHILQRFGCPPMDAAQLRFVHSHTVQEALAHLFADEAMRQAAHDFRKTMGDLAVDNHYRPFSEWAHRHGLLLHPESGGPHAVPVDSLRCLGMDDAPMSEFWAWSWRHRIGDTNRFFVKQPASAAH